MRWGAAAEDIQSPALGSMCVGCMHTSTLSHALTTPTHTAYHKDYKHMPSFYWGNGIIFGVWCMLSKHSTTSLCPKHSAILMLLNGDAEWNDIKWKSLSRALAVLLHCLWLQGTKNHRKGENCFWSGISLTKTCLAQEKVTSAVKTPLWL